MGYSIIKTKERAFTMIKRFKALWNRTEVNLRNKPDKPFDNAATASPMISKLRMYACIAN